jgi:hypothetical protein
MWSKILPFALAAGFIFLVFKLITKPNQSFEINEFTMN